MSPADGGFPAETAVLPATSTILLHGGRVLVLMEGDDEAPPSLGALIQDGGRFDWTAECWRVPDGDAGRWCGLAVIDALPTARTFVQAPGDPRHWRFPAATPVDVAHHPLADLVRKAGVDGRAVFNFLTRHLIEGRPADSAEAQAHQAFARGFFTAVAERDGFIEVLGEPESGGLFAQGWSMSLPAGAVSLASASGDLELHDVEVATFERDDILPPGHGFCLFGKDWRGAPATDIDTVFFERDGRLLRLDVVTSSLVRFAGAAATGHVAHMLPRLEGPAQAIAGFKRICRPRFLGEDTLSGAPKPVAMGLDAVLEAPDGGLLIMGWLLDPLHLVQLAVVKSEAPFYAQIQSAWVRLPRPDLCAGFATDPRFAGLLDPENALFGFIAHAPGARPAARPAVRREHYIELVLDDDSCLFRPLVVTPFASGERLPQILGALSPSEPELGRIIEEHLTPFLASVPPKAASNAAQTVARPIPLGPRGPARQVAAVMPVRSLAELQPIFGLLAGAPEAQAIDLILVAQRSAASEMLKALGEAYDFYGLKGALVIAGERDTLTARLDAGAAASDSARILVWTPQALPKGPGWLARMIAEADALPAPGLLSPMMTYEDGSIAYGASRDLARQDPRVCAVAGYGAEFLSLGAPTPAPAGAAEIALIARKTLTRAGGFAGRLFSDAYAQVDLSDRLARVGAGVWCSGAVDFWMLEDAQTGASGPFDRVLQQLDAALIARRGRELAGEIE
jgi:hypothetical protein